MLSYSVSLLFLILVLDISNSALFSCYCCMMSLSSTDGVSSIFCHICVMETNEQLNAGGVCNWFRQILVANPLCLDFLQIFLLCLDFLQIFLLCLDLDRFRSVLARCASPQAWSRWESEQFANLHSNKAVQIFQAP